jgi:hypothetical protein
MTETDLTLHDAIQVTVGAQLSSVTFVLDYWQLGFDGAHTFSIMTWLAVGADDRIIRSDEDGFRDRLCAQIAKTVRAADFVNKVLTITFEDGSTICAFARDEDYRQCPEALLFQSYKFKTLYVV